MTALETYTVNEYMDKFFYDAIGMMDCYPLGDNPPTPGCRAAFPFYYGIPVSKKKEMDLHVPDRVYVGVMYFDTIFSSSYGKYAAASTYIDPKEYSYPTSMGPFYMMRWARVILDWHDDVNYLDRYAMHAKSVDTQYDTIRHMCRYYPDKHRSLMDSEKRFSWMRGFFRTAKVLTVGL